MREYPKCMSWWDDDTCPICEVPLMSEYSNNDGSDGVFAEPEDLGSHHKWCLWSDYIRMEES